MMDYAQTGYRLWDIEKQKLIIARVIFNENRFWYKKVVKVRDEECFKKTVIIKQSKTQNGGIDTETDESENELTTNNNSG